MIGRIRDCLFALATLACVFSFSGCGALFKGSTQTIGVRSAQYGITIEVAGQTYESPTSIELQRDRDYVVSISKEGYETQQIRIHKKVSGGIVILDILGGLIPLLVDGLMGTWYNLSPDEITVNLKSKQTGQVDIPVKLVTVNDQSLRISASQPVQIKIVRAM